MNQLRINQVFKNGRPLLKFFSFDRQVKIIEQLTLCCCSKDAGDSKVWQLTAPPFMYSPWLVLACCLLRWCHPLYLYKYTQFLHSSAQYTNFAVRHIWKKYTKSMIYFSHFYASKCIEKQTKSLKDMIVSNNVYCQYTCFLVTYSKTLWHKVL